MHRHLSVFALFSRLALGKVLLILAAMTAAEGALTAVLGFPAAAQPGLWTLLLGCCFGAAYLGCCFACAGSASRRSRYGYTMQRLQISERWTLLWHMLSALCCLALLYCTQLLVFFALALLWQRGGSSLGPQSVLLLCYRSRFLHGLLPFGDSLLWWRNLIFLLSASVTCASAQLLARYRKQQISAGMTLVYLASRFPLPLQSSTNAVLSIIVCFVLTLITLGGAIASAHNGEGRDSYEEAETP